MHEDFRKRMSEGKQPSVAVIDIIFAAARLIIELAPGLALVFFGIWLIGAQVFWFLQDGVWTSMSVIDGVKWLFKDSAPAERAGISWIYAPSAWIGLHMILDWIPISGLSFVAGILMLIGADTPTSTAGKQQ